jgi:hypothetical protein
MTEDLARKSQTYFKPLNQDERESKLFLAGKKSSVIWLWNKGNPQKIKFQIVDYSKTYDKLILETHPKINELNHEVLFNFDIDGLSFFGAGILVEEEGEISIKSIKKLFKSERRATFRLLTYPSYEVYLEFFETSEPRVESSNNVVDFKTGVSQTGLFKDFLQLMQLNEGAEEGDSIKLRVQDISVTGLSFLVGQQEAQYFKSGELTGKLKIHFNSEVVDIDNARIVYAMPAQSKTKNMKMFKIGTQFIEIDQKADLQLGKLINQALRDVKEEFEDFIT